MPTPFFIVGASRSGTTLVRLLLNAHSQLAVPSELKYLNTIAGRASLRRWRKPGLTEDAYRDLVRAFLARRRTVFDAIGVEWLERVILADEERTLRAPYRVALEAWARFHGKERWGEKTPRNLFYVDVLADMFPDARFIYVARDPRAVVASMNRIAYFSDDTVLNALNVRRAMREGLAHLHASVPGAQRIALRYEDLVSDPEREARRLCAFLGEPFEPSLLSFHHNAAEFMGPVIRTPAVTSPVSTAHMEKWKRRLSQGEIAIVEAVCAEPMREWGYAPTEASVPLSNRLDRAMKGSYWTLKGWQHWRQRGYAVHYPPFGRTRTRLRRFFA